MTSDTRTSTGIISLVNPPPPKISIFYILSLLISYFCSDKMTVLHHCDISFGKTRLKKSGHRFFATPHSRTPSVSFPFLY